MIITIPPTQGSWQSFLSLRSHFEITKLQIDERSKLWAGHMNALVSHSISYSRICMHASSLGERCFSSQLIMKGFGKCLLYTRKRIEARRKSEHFPTWREFILDFHPCTNVLERVYLNTPGSVLCCATLRTCTVHVNQITCNLENKLAVPIICLSQVRELNFRPSEHLKFQDKSYPA